MLDLDKAKIVDIEGDGLLDEITKLHVLSCAYKDSSGKWQLKSTQKKEDVFRLLENENNIIVGHNFISFDLPALRIIFPDIQIRATIIDTLPLSYYLYSELQKHGLEEWGEFFGVPKPHIDPIEWKGPLPEETYEQFYNKMRNRCEEDCKINTNLWLKMLAYLREIYDHDDEAVWNVIKYLNFKAQCLHIQDVNPILIDVELAKKNLEYLEGIIEEKSKEIEKILPKVPIYAKRTPPKNPFKKDGSLSAHGEKWFSLLQEHGLPKDYLGEVQVITGYNEPNPTSPTQIKDFLFSKGWIPKIFKDGANGKVPQLRNDDKELCTSITKMFKEYPELEALEGLSVAEHRAGYLKNFVSMPNKEGYVSAWAHGFTRTLRLKHVKPFVNLPKPNAEHGELVRACMVAPKGYVCIGADLSSIEDKCKQISIYPYDPEYVMSMNTKGWDAHLALGLMAGMFTQDEVDFYKWLKSRDKETVIGELPFSFKDMTEEDWKEAFELLDKRRAVAKTGTYSLTYGAGAAKVAESADIPLKEAKKLHKGYWDMNWSVKKFAKDRIVKKVKGHNWLQYGKKKGGLKEVQETTWIWNEFSKMWLFLKNDKDRFSACNQNFGVKVFDVWGYFLIEKGIRPIFQSHDEFLWYCKEEDVERDLEIVRQSVKRLNNVFKPPVPLEIDYKVGKNYSEVH